MDTIRYRCPVHGEVAVRNPNNIDPSEDLRTCPFKYHPFDDECGRALIFAFAQNNQDQSTSH